MAQNLKASRLNRYDLTAAATFAAGLADAVTRVHWNFDRISMSLPLQTGQQGILVKSEPIVSLTNPRSAPETVWLLPGREEIDCADGVFCWVIL